MQKQGIPYKESVEKTPHIYRIHQRAHIHTHTRAQTHTHNTYMHMHMHMHVYRSNTCRQTGAVGTILHVVRTGANIHANIQSSYDSKHILCTA